MVPVKVVFSSLVSIKEQLEPIVNDLSDDGLDTYSDDCEDILTRINNLIVIVARHVS